MPLPVRRALLSVSDKTGLIELARGLAAARRRDAVHRRHRARTVRRPASRCARSRSHTGFPEIMDGRVKTLHPKIHGGLLGRRGADEAVMARAWHRAHRPPGGEPVPVRGHRGAARMQLRRGGREHRHRRPGHAARGGQEPRVGAGGRRPGRLRAAARGARRARAAASSTRARASPPRPSRTRPPTTPWSAAYLAAQHALAGRALSRHPAAGVREGAGPALRREPAPAARRSTATGGARRRRRHCARAAGQGAVVQQHRRRGHRHRVRAAVRRAAPASSSSTPTLRRGGRAPARSRPTRRAYRTDPTSAFGGIIAFNRELDADDRRGHHRAPVRRGAGRARRSRGRAAVLAAKPNVRVLVLGELARAVGHGARAAQRHGRPAGAGARSRRTDRRVRSRVATRRAADARRNWPTCASPGASCKFVKSNAIVFARDGATIGVGAGQMSRVYSTRIAAMKAADERLGVERRGHGLGRVLPVPRQSRRRRRVRHPRGHPARAAASATPK